MCKKLIIISLLFILVGCGENNNSTPAEPTVIPSGVVTMATWQPAQREDGSQGTATGYKVYCASQPNYQPANGIDVGNTTSYVLEPLITSDGLWYCSVAPYDAIQEYARQGESSVRREQGVFYLP